MSFARSEFFSDTFTDCLRVFVRGMKGRTGEEYWGAVRILCDYLQKDFLDITEIDAGKFFDYMGQRAASGTLRNNTINMRRSCYNMVSNFIVDRYPELEFSNPFVLLRPMEYNSEIRPSQIPSLQEIDAFLSACKDSPMYYLIFTMAFRIALSATEIIDLCLPNIQRFDKGLCICYPAKNAYSSDKVIPLPSDVSDMLEQYVRGLEFFDEKKHLFYNKHNHPLTLRNLDDAVQRYIKKSGVENKYTLKDLRTRAILDMVKASGGSEKALQNIASYTGIKDLRMSSYARATHLVEECPADLVNIQIKGR